MEKNKEKRIYESPTTEIIKVQTMQILAASLEDYDPAADPFSVF